MTTPATQQFPAQPKPPIYHYFCSFCHEQWNCSMERGDGPCAFCDHESVREIIVHLEFPPIPIRQFDYRAGFDGDEESNNCGWGVTRNEAINDLIANYGDSA